MRGGMDKRVARQACTVAFAALGWCAGPTQAFVAVASRRPYLASTSRETSFARASTRSSSDASFKGTVKYTNESTALSAGWVIRSSTTRTSTTAFPPPSPYAAVARCRQLNKDIVRAENDVHALLAIVSTSVEQFDGVNCATMVNRLSKAAAACRSTRRVAQDTRVHDLLMPRLAVLAESMTAREVANVINGLAKLEVLPRPGTLRVLSDRAQAQLQCFTPQELAISVHGFAKLVEVAAHHYDDTGYDEHLESYLKDSQWTADGNEGAVEGGYVGGSGGGMGVYEEAVAAAEGLVEALEAEPQALSVVRNGDAQNVANVLLALAKLECTSTRLLTALVGRASVVLSSGHFQPQQVANTLYALARLMYNKDPSFIDLCLASSLPQLQRFSATDLSSIFNALARLSHNPHPQSMRLLMRRWMQVLPSSDGQDLSCTLNALARFEHRPRVHELDRMTARMVEIRDTLTPQGLATSLNGLARMEYRPSPLSVKVLTETACNLMDKQDSQGLSLVISSLARLGSTDATCTSPLVLSFLRCSLSLLPTFTPQHLSTSAQALALLHTTTHASIPQAYLSALTHVSAHTLAHASAEHISQFLYSLSLLSYHPGRAFLRALGMRAKYHLPWSPVRYAALMLVAHANLDTWPSRQLWDAAAAAVTSEQWGHQATLTDVSNSLWALAVLELPARSLPVLQAIVPRACTLLTVAMSDVTRPAINMHTSTQLQQALLGLDLLGRAQDAVGHAEWARLRDVVRSAWEACGKKERCVERRGGDAAVRSEVASLLEGMGLIVRGDVACGPYTLDLVVLFGGKGRGGSVLGSPDGTGDMDATCYDHHHGDHNDTTRQQQQQQQHPPDAASQRPWVIEIDSHNDVLVGDSGRAGVSQSGATLLKRRILDAAVASGALGGVMCISAGEWALAASRGDQAKAALIRSKVATGMTERCGGGQERDEKQASEDGMKSVVRKNRRKKEFQE